METFTCFVLMMVATLHTAFCANPPGSCQDLYKTSTNPTSQEYQFTSHGHTFHAFCDFYDRHGYMFLSPEGLSVVNDLSHLYSDRSHVLVRHRQTDGHQKDVEIAPHSAFKGRYPLTFQLSKADGFTVPLNAAMKPYIFVGFLPESYAKSRTQQGYQAAGVDLNFNNCDSNPNSYFAFFANPSNLTANDYYKQCCMTPLVDAWIKKATDTPSIRYLPQRYFLEFEMHMGGCGGYVSKESFPTVSGAAVGLRFDACKRC